MSKTPSSVIKQRQKDAQQADRAPTKVPDAEVDGFLSFEELWQDPDEAGAAVDPIQRLREQEEELRQRGEEIIRESREKATQIEEDAFRQGYDRGHEEGLAAGREEYRAKIEELAALFEAVEGTIGERNRHHEEELYELVKTMVSRLVNHEVSSNPEVIRGCLRHALNFVAENATVRVRLHPDDFSRLKEASLEDPGLLEGRRQIELIEDPTMSAGGCFLETDFGEVDARLETARDKLYAAVDNAFRAAQGDDDRQE